jgi:hypothetical protein
MGCSMTLCLCSIAYCVHPPSFTEPWYRFDHTGAPRLQLCVWMLCHAPRGICVIRSAYMAFETSNVATSSAKEQGCCCDVFEENPPNMPTRLTPQTFFVIAHSISVRSNSLAAPAKRS